MPSSNSQSANTCPSSQLLNCFSFISYKMFDQLEFVRPRDQDRNETRLGPSSIKPAKMVLRKPVKFITKTTKAAEAHRAHQKERFPRCEEECHLQKEKGWNDDTRTKGWFDKAVRDHEYEKPVKQERVDLYRRQQLQSQRRASEQRARQLKEKPVDKQVDKPVKLQRGTTAKQVRCVQDQDDTFTRQKRAAVGRQPRAQKGQNKLAEMGLSEQERGQLGSLLKATADRIRDYSLTPFLERASHKLIALHSSTITQLLIDDILLETVGVLNEMDSQEQKRGKVKKQQHMIEEFQRTVAGYFQEVSQIRQRSALDPADRLILDPARIKLREINQLVQDIHYSEYATVSQFDLVAMRLGSQAQSIKEGRQRFVKSCNPQLYDAGLDSLLRLVDQIEEQLLGALCREIDEGSDSLVELLFANEFK